MARESRADRSGEGLVPLGRQPGKVLKALARTWQRQRRRVLRDPTPETVHRLRTAARRLEAAGRIAGEQFGLVETVPWTDWGSLNSKLSRLRNLDVTRQILAEIQPEGPTMPEALRQRLAELAQERKRVRRKATKKLERRGSGHIARLAARLASRLSPPVDLTRAARRWWARAGETFTIDPDLGQSLGQALRRHSGRAAVHQVRIQLRNLRYGLEWWTALGLVVSPKVIAFLQDTQDTLGRIRDTQRAATALVGPKHRRARSAVMAARRTELARWPSVVKRSDLLRASPFERTP